MLSLFTRLPTLCFVPFPSFIRICPLHCLACLSASLPSILSFSRLAIFSLRYPAAHRQHPASRPAPGPVQLSHHTRAHALVTLPSGPATALYTMGPTHAPASGSHLDPPAKLKSRPLCKSRRLAGLTSTTCSNHAGTLSPHAMTACATRKQWQLITNQP